MKMLSSKFTHAMSNFPTMLENSQGNLAVSLLNSSSKTKTVLKVVKKCRECSEATLLDTGSTISYLCKKSGKMKTHSDLCDVNVEME